MLCACVITLRSVTLHHSQLSSCRVLSEAPGICPSSFHFVPMVSCKCGFSISLACTLQPSPKLLPHAYSHSPCGLFQAHRPGTWLHRNHWRSAYWMNGSSYWVPFAFKLQCPRQAHSSLFPSRPIAHLTWQSSRTLLSALRPSAHCLFWPTPASHFSTSIAWFGPSFWFLNTLIAP